MRCLSVVLDEGQPDLGSIPNKKQHMNRIVATGVYISILPAYTSILFSSCHMHTTSILNYLDIT
jgi:hypothetical protein